MFLNIIAYLTNLSHLRGIPGVSAWVGSRRWARIIAWWLFPLILWGTVTVFLLQAVQVLYDLGFQLTRNPLDPIWPFIVVIVSLACYVACVISVILGILSMLGSVFLERSQEKRSIDVPLVDYLDPDYFLKVSYVHTVQEKL
jgi:hypothetical protein